MKAVCGLLCGVALVLVAGRAGADAKSDAEKALLGKWERKEKVGGKEVTLLLTFDKDGKLSMKLTGPAPNAEITGTGTYKVVDASHLEISLTAMGQTKNEKSQFKVVDKNTLELKTADGKNTETFTRAK